eukprot:25906-Chlamydomonas_euryale.AAC.1
MKLGGGAYSLGVRARTDSTCVKRRVLLEGVGGEHIREAPSCVSLNGRPLFVWLLVGCPQLPSEAFELHGTRKHPSVRASTHPVEQKRGTGIATLHTIAHTSSSSPTWIAHPAPPLRLDCAPTTQDAWGERKLPLLEAEDRLMVACERGVTEDEATLKLRDAYN